MKKNRTTNATAATALSGPTGALLLLGVLAVPIGLAMMRPRLLADVLDKFSRSLDPYFRDRDHNLIHAIKSAIEPLVSNPGSVVIQARDGYVTLKGPILKSELKAVLAAVHGIGEVKNVADHLEIHETAEGVPGLQGRRVRHIPDPNDVH